MGNKQYGCGKPARNHGNCKKSDSKNLAFIMIVFGLVSVCAFFLPIKAWILLLGGLLVYCGLKLR
ncbi:hypothetical protein Ami103574_08515 [Aminipila butyrica]|uniref:Uncharacterized protein n=1 Tax=Aminipila butyrica TaxID=433296 RepID=A0A858BWB4_9FIRM|nr:hypothetical protein [Aminipila butyrica]QIB69365.1 hypothetical protein Ami103574_08515 [Aminipila butyrica]